MSKSLERRVGALEGPTEGGLQIVLLGDDFDTAKAEHEAKHGPIPDSEDVFYIQLVSGVPRDPVNGLIK